MEKRTGAAPMRTSRLIGVWELDKGLSATDGWVRLTVSVPGREGTFTKVWPAVDGRLTESQLEDFTAFVAQSITDAALYSTGVQQELFRGGL